VAAGSAKAQDAFEANLFTTPVETAEELTSIVPLNALNADAPPPPPAAGAADPSTAEPSGIPPSPAGESAEGFDPAVVAIGRAAFEARCLDCHDAEKSLQKRKTYAGWLATVRRMAAKADADIPEPTHVPIATYLTAVAGAPDGSRSKTVDVGGFGSLTPNATFATLWRGTSESGLTSPGFFVDAWLGADWQSEGPLSATVMTCTSCHSDNTQEQSFTLEFVEASATLDLKKAWKKICGDTCPDQSRWSLKLKGGRFIVPFGAFASMVHPGSLRTVSNPLMFDMARRFDSFRYLSVLPAPYSDEGFNLNFATTISDDFRFTADAYVVNGLQGDINISFINSRSYRDNNRSPLVGSRLTFGNQAVRLGTSFMGGNTEDDGNTPLWVELYGADLTAQFGDALRLYFEYALRNGGQTLPLVGDNIAYGVVCEAEVRLLRDPRLSLVARYDNLIQKGYLIFPDTAVDRYTWGLNLTLPGGSLLMLNHEHWEFTGDRSDADVLALKWVASF
jgi:hypothetical protein